MIDILLLDAPPSFFEELPELVVLNGFECEQTALSTITKGIRGLDTAVYEIRLDSVRVDVSLERRLGNRSMTIAVMPIQRWLWRHDHDSQRLATRISSFLCDHGAVES